MEAEFGSVEEFLSCKHKAMGSIHSLVLIIENKNILWEGQWESSAGKDSSFQAWWPAFDS